jgi:hypothetical protein
MNRWMVLSGFLESLLSLAVVLYLCLLCISMFLGDPWAIYFFLPVTRHVKWGVHGALG